MSTFSLVTQLLDGYNWFKATSLGYPLRKLDKAIPDLVLGLRYQDSRKPISRNLTIIASTVIGYLLGVLTPIVFVPELMQPLVVFAQSVLKPIGIQISSSGLAGLGIFLFSTVIAVIAIHLAKSLYGLIYSQNTPSGRITNQGMLIPQIKKEALAKDLRDQIRFDRPRAHFTVAELDAYADAIQERYVKFRDLVRHFDANPHARLIATEMQISTLAAAQSELAKAKEAMEDLKEGDWPAVNFYLEGLETERTRHREYYESQRRRIEATQQHLTLTNSAVTLGTLAEEGPLVEDSLSHLTAEETARLLTLELKHTRPQTHTVFGWAYNRQKTVIPLQDLEAGVSGLQEAKQILSEKINSLQGPVPGLPSLV